MSLQDNTGVLRLRKIGENVTVVEFTNGGVRPATDLEVRMWDVLTKVASKV